jgi:hypothetical protein
MMFFIQAAQCVSQEMPNLQRFATGGVLSGKPDQIAATTMNFRRRIFQ